MRSPLLRLLAAVALLGCPGLLRAQAVTELYVSPDTLRLTPGERQGLAVQAFDEAGNAILAIRYRSSDEQIAKVSSSGAVTALNAGRALITVSAGKRSRTVPVIVTGAERPAPPVPAAEDVALLVADPAALVLLPAEHARIQVRPVRADGTPAAPVRVIWRSLRPEVAAVVDSSGVVAGVSTGQGVIQAAAPNGVTVSIPVVVSLSEFSLSTARVALAPQEAETLFASVPAQGGRRLRSADLQWSSSDLNVAQVSSEGVVRAISPGRAEIVARGFLQERKVTVVVYREVALFLTRPRLTEVIRLPASGTREVKLEVQSADSMPVEGVPVTWTVGDTSVASFDPATGLLRARRPGSTTLSFQVRGFVPKGWSVEVLPGRLGLDRSRVGLRVGDWTTLAASFVGEGGRPLLPAENVTWRSANPEIARVNAQGGLEAVAPGRTQVVASLPNGESVQATVFVTGDLLVASTRAGRFGIFALTAANPDLFVPVLTDSAGNSLDGAYSPDRTRIAFASDRLEPGNFDIFVADADGQNPVRLTTSAAVDAQPVWTPDGERMVFVSGRTGTRQLFIMNADGSDQRQLTSLAGGAVDPAISPDGRTVAFTGFPGGREGQSDIYLVPLAGGTPSAVTATADRRESRPVWLPEGELAWVQGRKDRKEPDVVLRRPAGGGPPVPLVASDYPLADVALARDGSRIVWVSSRPSERNRSGAEFTLQWRSLTNGAQTSVRLLPGERITSPAF